MIALSNVLKKQHAQWKILHTLYHVWYTFFEQILILPKQLSYYHHSYDVLSKISALSAGLHDGCG
jgi:hypothetical protein